MPELPEVETVRMQLRHGVVGKTIREVEVFHSKSAGDDSSFEDALVGKTISDIDRVGKLMIFSFEKQKDLFMLAHLKMTGQFFIVNGKDLAGGGHTMSAGDTEVFPGRHTRISFRFTDGTMLYFNDMRKFGYMRLVGAAALAAARAKYGPEPISADFDCKWFEEELKKKKTTIKAALLQQHFVAGLGNIYVDEALWRAQVKPMRKANSLKQKEAAALCAAARDVLRESINVGGTTFQHFKDTEGQNGNFKQYLQVFGKQGSPCVRCGKEIIKIKCAGRGTHYCPGCQK